MRRMKSPFELVSNEFVEVFQKARMKQHVINFLLHKSVIERTTSMTNNVKVTSSNVCEDVRRNRKILVFPNNDNIINHWSAKALNNYRNTYKKVRFMI
jgi:hypothetical protein